MESKFSPIPHSMTLIKGSVGCLRKGSENECSDVIVLACFESTVGRYFKTLGSAMTFFGSRQAVFFDPLEP